MGAYDDYERFTRETEEHPEDRYSCDVCADMGCAKCSPEFAVEHSLAAAIDCILDGTPIGGAR